jgi:hypothetical protein
VPPDVNVVECISSFCNGSWVVEGWPGGGLHPVPNAQLQLATKHLKTLTLLMGLAFQPYRGGKQDDDTLFPLEEIYDVLAV